MLFTSMVNQEYLPGLFALLSSLEANSELTDLKLLLVCEEPLSPRVQEALTQTAVEIEFLPRQALGEVEQIVPQVMPRFAYTLKKLLMFRLPVQEPVCYLDIDMLCLNPLHGLDQLEPFAAAADIGLRDHPSTVGGYPMFNSGLMIYRPSEEFYGELQDFYRTRNYDFNYGDQQVTSLFLQERYPESLHWLDSSWNTLKRRLRAAPQGIDWQQVKFLHLVGQKPWERPWHSSDYLDYCELNHLWWNYFRQSPGPQAGLDLPPEPDWDKLTTTAWWYRQETAVVSAVKKPLRALRRLVGRYRSTSPR